MEQYIQQMHEYFRAEKLESLLFVGIGIAAVAVALYSVIKLKESFFNGMAIPLVTIGLIQIVVGGTVLLRSDKQVADLETQLRQTTTQYFQQELPRMEKVNANFDTYKYVEIALIAIGIALMLVFKGRIGEQAFWLGFGTGLFMQATLMLSADMFAEKRADEYTARIVQLRQQYTSGVK